MPIQRIVVPTLVVCSVAALVTWAARSPKNDLPSTAESDQIAESVAKADRWFTQFWQESDLRPAPEADELQILRRLYLALHGTIPSLEEIRSFENDNAPNRLDRWVQLMLKDNRYHHYFAERLARSYVGVDGGAFLLFRRDRFVDWLAEELAENTAYDQIVRTILSEQGLWTGRPATNFVTSGLANDLLDQNKLTSRAVRAFLGQSIDCAQCHDHPFESWKQRDFEGLAAHFGQVKLSPVGVEDTPKQVYEVEDRESLEKRVVEPQVPFNPEWLPADGTRRAKLAAWITHPDNRRFERAIANRVWGLMFGRPFVQPVDDIPDPDPSEIGLLDVLGQDFREHGYDLRRMIRVIASSNAFRVASTATTDDEQQIDLLKDAWAIFPLARLRPEQVIGSMLQAASVQTVDQNSHLIVRAMRYFREQDFVRDYGDLGDAELGDRAGTIPQALLRMNGNLVRETTEPGPFTSSGRAAGFARSDEKCLEVCYLVCLSRRPTADEKSHFLAQLEGQTGDTRGKVVEDIYWSLFNSPEFSWNH